MPYATLAAIDTLAGAQQDFVLTSSPTVLISSSICFEASIRKTVCSLVDCPCRITIGQHCTLHNIKSAMSKLP